MVGILEPPTVKLEASPDYTVVPMVSKYQQVAGAPNGRLAVEFTSGGAAALRIRRWANVSRNKAGSSATTVPLRLCQLSKPAFAPSPRPPHVTAVG